MDAHGDDGDHGDGRDRCSGEHSDGDRDTGGRGGRDGPGDADRDDGDDGDPAGPAGHDGPGPGGVPNVAAARDRVVLDLLEFVRVLRRAGATVPANASLTAARALVAVGLDEEARARSALRATLVSNPADAATFDRLFPEFWRRLVEGLRGDGGRDPDAFETPDGRLAGFDASGTETDDGSDADGDREDGADDPDGSEASEESAPDLVETAVGATEGDDSGDEDDETATTALYSPSGRSESLSVGPAALTGYRNLDRAMNRLAGAIAGLSGRRWARSGQGDVDARRALRESLSTGGTAVDLPERERAESAVGALVLVDVSRSVLDAIDRGFLIAVLRRMAAWRRVRIFLFDTSVREATRAFDAPTERAALDALERAEAEWGGGTRIGNALTTVREEYPESVDRDTTAFVISDGLEMGEIDELEAGTAWLARRARAVLWCNPLARSPEYEPTARGMAAALPALDGLFAFAGPADLDELARQLDRRGTGGPLGYEFDHRHRGAGEA
ncbi:VWA containing CoxE-like protein [Halobacteriales archaeon QS_4_69_34]|nr:MAG: VWA containing CoxE-like protein [Halobacteriales archaeon QS_4_69_34]